MNGFSGFYLERVVYFQLIENEIWVGSIYFGSFYFGSFLIDVVVRQKRIGVIDSVEYF